MQGSKNVTKGGKKKKVWRFTGALRGPVSILVVNWGLLYSSKQPCGENVNAPKREKKGMGLGNC